MRESCHTSQGAMGYDIENVNTLILKTTERDTIAPEVVFLDFNDKLNLEKFISNNNVFSVYDRRPEILEEIFNSLHPHIHPKNPNYSNSLSKFKKNNGIKFNLIYFPWNGNIAFVPIEEQLKLVNTSRNREQITNSEQKSLYDLKIGIIGLSVGQSSLLNLIKSGTGSEYRLADYDELSLSNSNRLPRSGITEVGLNKTYLAGRLALESNPYLKIKYYPNGLNNRNDLKLFAEGLDYVVDAFDTLPLKLELRKLSKEMGFTVVMGTDLELGALIDIETPNDEIFQGRLSKDQLKKIEEMKSLDPRDLVSIISAILGVNFEEIERMSRHFKAMSNGELFWMSQLVTASSHAGAGVTNVIIQHALGYTYSSRVKI